MTTVTSSRSYRNHVLRGKAKSQREVIQLCISTHAPVSRRQIKELTGFEINAVTGRVNTLLKSKLVRVAFERRDPRTDRVVEYLECVLEQGELF